MFPSERIDESIAVIHLVRKANGLTPFRDFLKSLKWSGVSDEFQLVLVFKGFGTSDLERADYLAEMAGIKFQSIDVSDEGVDITAYFYVAERIQADVFIFFNSFSKILIPDWFSLFKKHFFQPSVGLIGATASFESTFSAYKESQTPQGLYQKVRSIIKLIYLYILFPPFPNPHLRSNAFMIRRQDFLETKRRIRTKMDALAFESGRNSLSFQMKSKGLKTLLISKQGRALDCTEWRSAKVFRRGEQEDLLVSDNQTRSYEAADQEHKKFLQTLAWGKDVS